MIGLDFNADHIALCETDRNGSIVHARRISLPGLGKKNHNYNQGISHMMTAIKKITTEARARGKDLVIEDLDFSEKKSDLKKNKNYNRMITQLAYAAIKKITTEARARGKDLVIEDLDFSEKKSDLKKNKNYNRMITQLAYGQYTHAVKRRCFKDNVDLKIVNPAYTSKKAKQTVCKELGINIHLGAACLIARRGLGLF